jgi:hypothetical protein
MSLETTQILSVLFDWSTALTQGDFFSFVAQSECDNCPGAENTLVAAAWANIAYMTHSALLYYINFSGFGVWAPLLYLIGAIGALVAVALNSPPRNYTWFVLGPAIYGFLVGSTQEVKGVDWVVAGYPQDMQEVWRDAETGMRNSPAPTLSLCQCSSLTSFSALPAAYWFSGRASTASLERVELTPTSPRRKILQATQPKALARLAKVRGT